ncbi:MAG TPA: hypothetical protein VI298_02405 [Geobacteraceae bacterium]
MGPVKLEEIRESAIRIVTRLALGEYVLRGPHDNILELESRVAWATVATELHNEGYVMVPIEGYATICGLQPAAVSDMIETDGSLFALVHAAAGGEGALVPLPNREEREHLGPIPE